MVKITKKGKKAWVTFTAPDTVAGAENVMIKGSWNDWIADPLKRKKNGEFYITKVLPTGQTYEFGYEVDDSAWVIDNDLPTVETPFGSLNSVLKL